MLKRIPITLDRFEDSPFGPVAVLYLTDDPGIKIHLPGELFEGCSEVNFLLIPDPATTADETERIEELQGKLKGE